MNATTATLLMLDINSRRRLHYNCATHQEIADQTDSRFIPGEATDEGNDEAMTNNPSSLVARARLLVTASGRDSLRAAKQQRRHALHEYRRALDEMPPRHYAAVKAYAVSLSAEAAAHRADAAELRDVLAGLVGIERQR